MKKQKRPATRAKGPKTRSKSRRVGIRPTRLGRSTRSARTVRSARSARPVKRPSAQRVAKAQLRTRVKAAAKPSVEAAVSPAQKAIRKLRPGAMQKAITRMAARTTVPPPRAVVPPRTKAPHRLEASRPTRPAAGTHTVNRQLLRMAGAQQYKYMRAPGLDTGFEVGDPVEVFCDHERDSERVRGWLKGTVVQVDNKLVAVQFRTNVFLTDGWMVPDRILWYSLTSDQIRAANFGKKGARKPVPEY
jgi:hypothetical protein